MEGRRQNLTLRGKQWFQAGHAMERRQRFTLHTPGPIDRLFRRDRPVHRTMKSRNAQCVH